MSECLADRVRICLKKEVAYRHLDWGHDGDYKNPETLPFPHKGAERWTSNNRLDVD